VYACVCVWLRRSSQRLDDAASAGRATTLALEMDAALSCRELMPYTGGDGGAGVVGSSGQLALGGPEPEADTTGARAAAAAAMCDTDAAEPAVQGKDSKGANGSKGGNGSKVGEAPFIWRVPARRQLAVWPDA
jgi:hypothetical protein